MTYDTNTFQPPTIENGDWWSQAGGKSASNGSNNNNDNVPDVEATFSEIEAWLATTPNKFDATDVEDNPDLAYFAARYIHWLRNQDDPKLLDNNFLIAMSDALFRWKRLTNGQAKGVLNWWRANAQRAARPASKPQGKPGQPRQGKPDKATVDLSALPSGYYADPSNLDVSDPESRLKIRVSNYIIRKKDKDGNEIPNGKWDGWVFVDDGAVYGQRRKYGSQRPGSTYNGDIHDVLARIAADPKGAVIMYGRLTSICGICHRPLEDKRSVEVGVGPICAQKWGIPY